MKRGCVHWVQLDKRRPAVIISPDRRNELAGDIIVLPCTTSLRPMVWHVLLERGEGGLKERTMVKCEQVLTLPRDLVSEKPLGSPLRPSRMHQIERALLLALGILLPTTGLP